MSREHIDDMRRDIAVEQQELRKALKEYRYDRAASIASRILQLVMRLRELDTRQIQEVAQ